MLTHPASLKSLQSNGLNLKLCSCFSSLFHLSTLRSRRSLRPCGLRAKGHSLQEASPPYCNVVTHQQQQQQQPRLVLTPQVHEADGERPPVLRWSIIGIRRPVCCFLRSRQTLETSSESVSELKSDVAHTWQLWICDKVKEKFNLWGL